MLFTRPWLTELRYQEAARHQWQKQEEPASFESVYNSGLCGGSAHLTMAEYIP
jgi:hypothetical protein